MSEPIGLTKPHAGVMATRPATMPEAMPSMDGLPRSAHSTNIHTRAAIAVATSVLIIAAGIAVGQEFGTRVEAEPADPQEKAPIMVRTRLCWLHVLRAEAL